MTAIIDWLPFAATCACFAAAVLVPLGIFVLPGEM